jgi:hypothetical protein
MGRAITVHLQDGRHTRLAGSAMVFESFRIINHSEGIEARLVSGYRESITVPLRFSTATLGG